MDERTLGQFREMAAGLSMRKKIDISISFSTKDGKKEVIQAKFDPMFSSIELKNATVPNRELRQWLKLLYGADVKTINITY